MGKAYPDSMPPTPLIDPFTKENRPNMPDRDKWQIGDKLDGPKTLDRFTEKEKKKWTRQP